MVLAHGEMAEALHHRGRRAGALGDLQRALRGAGIIVFAGEQVERTAGDVDLAEPVADVAVGGGVEVEIAREELTPNLGDERSQAAAV